MLDPITIVIICLFRKRNRKRSPSLRKMAIPSQLSTNTSKWKADFEKNCRNRIYPCRNIRHFLRNNPNQASESLTVSLWRSSSEDITPEPSRKCYMCQHSGYFVLEKSLSTQSSNA